MLPQTLESWIFLAAACIIGILLGRWLRKRQGKTAAGSEPISRMYDRQRKRLSKKERRKAHRHSSE